MNLEIINQMTEEEVRYVSKQLRDFNFAIAPPSHDYSHKDVHLMIKDDTTILGGLIGKIYRGALFIDRLWLSETIRGQGYGKTLLQQAEMIAIESGCLMVHLDTFSFQAPDFYQKYGYVIFGVLEGYEADVKRYFLKKDLKK